MNRTSIAVAFVVLAAALAPAQDKPPAAPPPANPPQQAKPAAPKADEAKKAYVVGDIVDPALAFVDLEGKPHTLKEYLGKTIVLDFWSIECPISKGYEARFKEIHSEYSKKGIVFLMIDANVSEIGGAGADPFAAIKKYVKDQSIPYPVLADKKNVVADRFGAQTTPHVFILDEKGKLRYAGGVDDDPDIKKDSKAVKSYLREALDALIAGKEPPQTKTKEHGCSIKRVPASN
jgi:thiol-disulfide isomerase/thioredoxin